MSNILICTKDDCCHEIQSVDVWEYCDWCSGIAIEDGYVPFFMYGIFRTELQEKAGNPQKGFGIEPVCKATLNDHTLYCSTSHGLARCQRKEGKRVVGSLVLVEDFAIYSLDRLERGYKRETVEVTLENGQTLEAQVYMDRSNLILQEDVEVEDYVPFFMENFGERFAR